MYLKSKPAARISAALSICIVPLDDYIILYDYLSCNIEHFMPECHY